MSPLFKYSTSLWQAAQQLESLQSSLAHNGKTPIPYFQSSLCTYHLLTPRER